MKMRMTTSPATIEQTHKGIYELKFKRNRTVSNDTGWYGCSDIDVPTSSNIYTDPNIKWTYVYVKCMYTKKKKKSKNKSFPISKK